MRRMGGLAKVGDCAVELLVPLLPFHSLARAPTASQDATPNTCVTVCGVSGELT